MLEILHCIVVRGWQLKRMVHSSVDSNTWKSLRCWPWPTDQLRLSLNYGQQDKALRIRQNYITFRPQSYFYPENIYTTCLNGILVGTPPYPQPSGNSDLSSYFHLFCRESPPPLRISNDSPVGMSRYFMEPQGPGLGVNLNSRKTQENIYICRANFPHLQPMAELQTNQRGEIGHQHVKAHPCSHFSPCFDHTSPIQTDDGRVA